MSKRSVLQTTARSRIRHGIAFEMALVALRLAGRGDLANEVLAHRIIDLAKAGERDPERLSEGVLLQEFRAPPHV